MRSSPSIIQAMETVFAAVFKRGWLRDSWKAWRAFLSALFALEMSADARETYRKHTGRDDLPGKQFRECFCIVGRRGGKSIISALVGTYLAVFRDYSDVLAPGETGVVMVLAADRNQARVIFGYIAEFFTLPLLAPMVRATLAQSIELKSHIRIEIHTSSFRAVRGYTVVAAICDELAYWSSEDSANPDTETLNAIRPAMATIPNALLLCISSPYAKRGELWRAFRENYGKPSDVLVWKASSREMNSTLSPAVVAAAYLRDAASARAEYGGEFRDDVESFISVEVVESRIVPGTFELAPVSGLSYVGFVDPSGGSGSDSMTLAIAHERDGSGVLDLLREIQAPFSPENACSEFSDALRRYGLSEVQGDRYGGDWPREQFAKRGINYRPSEKTRSELYLALLPALMSGQVELLDNQRLVNQLVGLERRTARGGKDSVDHGSGAHDDVANAAAGALVLAWTGYLPYGLLTFLKAGGDANALGQAKPRLATAPAAAKPAEAEANGACPNCAGTTRVETVPGGQLRCQACGRQWWRTGKSSVVLPSRANLGSFRR